MLFLPLFAALSPTEVVVDTLKNFDIEEAVVVASPKETKQLRKQPLSVSLFDASSLKHRNVSAVKDLSAYAPNFFMPDYGSRLTSACYIRGIGSRINTPAVGLYVDNVPYADKSAYDFSFQGIERVDVLRGPQGTLYGRNTMGGLLRIFTASPITHHGTDVSAGIGTGWKTSKTMLRNASFTTYLHPAERMGLSVGGYYEGKDGFFTNTANHKKQGLPLTNKALKELAPITCWANQTLLPKDLPQVRILTIRHWHKIVLALTDANYLTRA